MTLHWKLVVDTSDPHAQADFWAAALGYELEDHSALIARLRGSGQLPDDSTVQSHGREAWRDFVAVRHPDDPYDKDSGMGNGRRILFQRVPEQKTTKNRLHLDLHVGADQREAEVARLEALGARVLYDANEPEGVWTTMADPEGNEFCVE
ncbi:VOC family protein [Streptomyces sp. NPDC019890]|uniref:VOC family protein n=1 Tax=Streptomyces sp. NPDC019890 TaxID=3365064 RepID=UPI00384B2079